MLGEQVSNRINLKRLGARATLAAALSVGFSAAVTSMVWAQEPASPSATGQDQGRSDADIQSDVAYALSHSKALQGQHITAATIEGDVTVSGNVRDEASKELAETLLYKVKGVRSVTNNLNVGDAPQTNTANAQPQASNTTPEQDLNYDPAQANMAPTGPQDQSQQQAQGAPAPDQLGDAPPAPSQAQMRGAPDPGQQQPYPAQRQPYSQPYEQQQSYGQPPYQQQSLTAVTIPSGTLLQVRTSEPLDAARVQPGQVFAATVAADVYLGGMLALPRGAVITGKVVSTQSNKGNLAGRQGLSLVLTSVNLGGQIYTLPTDTWSGQGPGKGGYSAGNTIGTAGLGAVIGAIAGGGAGAAIGAGAGAIVGAGASAATTGPRMFVPAEAVLNFHLLAPVTVTPVSAQEAQRLASSAYPQMQRRGPYPYGPYGAYPPPPPPGYYYPYRYPAVYPSYYYGYRY
jgi:hypothetical protein